MNGNGNFFIDVNRNNLLLGLGINANIDFATGIYNQKANQYKAFAREAESMAVSNQIMLKSVHTYYDLLRSQLELQVYDFLLSHSDSIIGQMNVQQEQGMRYESEILMAKSSRSQLKVKAFKC